MARDKNTAQQADHASDAIPLAERLFAATWKIGGQTQDEHIAAKCLEAAETFERVRRERAGLRLAETA
jgi:hypothetical protein